jgi:hypothetical protein
MEEDGSTGYVESSARSTDFTGERNGIESTRDYAIESKTNQVNSTYLVSFGSGTHDAISLFS